MTYHVKTKTVQSTFAEDTAIKTKEPKKTMDNRHQWALQIVTHRLQKKN